MNNHTISIVVPIYNKEQFLSTTLDALLCQTYQDLEILLVDDGSTDSSGAICDAYASRDSRIRVIHQENRGVSAARNVGLDAAQGAFIGFCDSDDIPAPDLYETMLRLLEEHHCDIAMVKEAVRFRDGTMNDHQTGKLEIYDDRLDLMKRYLLGEISMGIYTKLVRAELCRRIRFDEAFRIREDALFIFELFLKANKACYLDVCKYVYFRNDTSCSQAPFSRKFLGIIHSADIIQDTIRRELPELADHATANTVIAYLRFMQLSILLDGGDLFHEEKKQITHYLKSVPSSVCKKHLPKKLYLKWRLFTLGRLSYHLSVKLFSREKR